MNKVYLWLYLTLTALYVGLSLSLPTDPRTLEKYNLTQTHAHLVNLAVVIPLVLVWSAALYGFLRFKSYSQTVEGTVEGKSFSQLATGLMVMAFSLPVSASVSSVFTYISYKHPSLSPSLIIVKNYINLLFSLAAFMQIANGAEMLTRTLKRKTKLSANNAALIGIIILTSLYIWLITTRTYGPSGDVAYYLPNWLIVSTLAMPYLFLWCKGIMAAYYLNAYQRKIRGKIYKRSLKYLAQGIVTIVILSIFIQIITTVSVQLTRLRLTPLLAIVYVLVGLYAVGYGLVARGAKKLKLIEEV